MWNFYVEKNKLCHVVFPHNNYRRKCSSSKNEFLHQMVGHLLWNTVLPRPGSHHFHLHACTCQSSKNLFTVAAEMYELLLRTQRGNR